MSLQSGIAAIIAGCINPLHPDFFLTEPGAEYQIKLVYGVNKVFWRTWTDVTLRWDCPGLPTTLQMSFYEHFDDPAITDPIIYIGGYVANCINPGPGLGTSIWIWMATLEYRVCQVPIPTPQYIHVQYKNTNVGSIGIIPYPTTPP
jgi:hypothetical protein